MRCSPISKRLSATGNSIETAVRGVGVEWARTITRTYDLAAMRGTAWASPRGPVKIGDSRAITQTIYIRQFQRADGKVRNVVVATYPDVPPDPQ